MRVAFVVGGVQKGGTKALDVLLRDEPGICMADVKEPHFFDNDRLDWDRPDYETYHERFPRPRAFSALCGESTPIYSYWPNALERLAKYNPESRVIMLLRHPTMRAFSHWQMQTRRGVERAGFYRIVHAGARWPDSVRVRPSRHDSYIARGFYSAQAERLLSLFGSERVLFLRTDDLWENPTQVMADVRRFLNLKARRKLIDTQYVGGPSQWRIEDRLRTYLNDLYYADIERTALLTGLDLSDWLSLGYREPMGV
jgi:hypothetical protein